MIHSLFTLQAHGHPVQEHLAFDIGVAVRAYASSIGISVVTGYVVRLTCAVWCDGVWHGHFQTNIDAGCHGVERVPEPPCFEPLPCPKPTPAVTAPAFAACAKDGQEVAFMALERRMRELGAEAEDYRGAGNDAMADVLVGHQSACVAALKVLREVAR